MQEGVSQYHTFEQVEPLLSFRPISDEKSSSRSPVRNALQLGTEMLLDEAIIVSEQPIESQSPKDVDNFFPILHRTMEQLNVVTQRDIDELRDMVTPATEIELLMACVMILFGHPTDWETSLLILNRPHCLSLFHKFNPDVIDQ